ncbi:MAG: ComF family protein [Ignavibacteria bacterium]|nr:ComF family protein [Ignavibacteria bacterium]
MRTLQSSDSLYRETRDRLRGMGHVDDLFSCFAFDREGPLQVVLHRLKYEGITALGEELGVRLGKHVASLAHFHAPVMIVPVPLHHAKQRERGYNQSVSICTGMTRIIPAGVFPGLLIRRRYTLSQTTLRREERRLNVLNAFALNPRYHVPLDNRTVVLVDDVITTGATIDGCASILLAHGAQRVIACSVALAP